ncbi:conserved hypothetical protein [Verrucomicrobia bacterium]|nr:conserved hypothetical protein [Verrucomicrobiota bacterium]
MLSADAEFLKAKWARFQRALRKKRAYEKAVRINNSGPPARFCNTLIMLHHNEGWRTIMSYRCVATSVAGFVQQLAVGYIANGHYFYVSGLIPPHKDPVKTDGKILNAYHIDVSKWTRFRRKREGWAGVQYLRYRHFYVIIATHGLHPPFAAEAERLVDIRRCPLQFMGYSIGCRRARGGGEYHASVRISNERYTELKSQFESVVLNRTVEELVSDFRHLRYEPYAPVRVQLFALLRQVNRRRKVAGLEQVPSSALRSGRSPVRPFDELEMEDKLIPVCLPEEFSTDREEEKK